MIRPRLCRFFFRLILLFFLTLISCKSDKYDLIIINGTILDGTGSDSFQADIGILDERIVEIGDLKNAEAKTIIDASGMVVSPGFIDMHTHLEPIMEMPDAKSLIMQGVTLALGGPDGGGPWPFGSYLDSLEQLGTGPNLAYLIGHNTIRREVMGNVDQAPTLSQMDSMKNYVEMAMKEGAFGISTGLKYLPGTFAKVDEIISLSKVASSYQGIYTSHLREEGLGLIDAVQEAILISKEAEIPVVLTHHKAIGVKMWGGLTTPEIQNARPVIPGSCQDGTTMVSPLE